MGFLKLAKVAVTIVLGLSSARGVNATAISNFARQNGVVQISCPTPGPSTIIETEFLAALQDFCISQGGATLQAGKGIYALTPASAGQLVFEIVNWNSHKQYLFDIDTCIENYSKVMKVCGESTGTFNVGNALEDNIQFYAAIAHNGTIPGRLVANSTLVSSSPAAAKDVVVRSAPNNCPAGVSSPYPGDITNNVNVAIAQFCGLVLPPILRLASTTKRDIKLHDYPSITVHFVAQEKCGQEFTDVNGCISVLSSNVAASYNACEYISADGTAPKHQCQHFTMLVGDL